MWDLGTYWRDTAHGGGGNFTSIPGRFRQLGYTTYGIGKIYHPVRYTKYGGNNNDYDIQLSWDKYFMPKNGKKYYTSNWKDLPFKMRDGCPGAGQSPTGWKGPSNCAWGMIPDQQLAKFPTEDTESADIARDLIGTWAKDTAYTSNKKNWFLALGFFKPHLPWTCPKRFFDQYPLDKITVPQGRSRYAPDGMPMVAWNFNGEMKNYNDFTSANENIGAVARYTGKAEDPKTSRILPDQDTKEMRRAYYACSSHADNELGRVMDALKNSPFLKNTVRASLAIDTMHILRPFGQPPLPYCLLPPSLVKYTSASPHTVLRVICPCVASRW